MPDECRYCGHTIKKDIVGLGWQHAQPGKMQNVICFARVEKSKNTMGYCNCDTPTPLPRQKPPEKPDEPKGDKPQKPKDKKPGIFDRTISPVNPTSVSNIW